MKRSITGFMLVSALTLLVGAAVYADDTSSMLSSPPPDGWFRANMVGESVNQVAADAQKLVGQSVDQVMKEMGSTRLQAPDKAGGTDYFYEVQLGSGPGGLNEAQIWVEVDNSNKVVNVEVST